MEEVTAVACMLPHHLLPSLTWTRQLHTAHFKLLGAMDFIEVHSAQ